MSLITLLTDFGTADSYVAEVKGVLLSAVPSVALVDVTHAVLPGDVRAGAYLLGRVWHRFPPGTVHLAVVDPGVGTGRAALALSAHGHYFVGPDNGLFTFVLRDAEVRIVSLPTPDGASSTFHGRDLFAPVAAHLASGCEPAAAGDPIDPGTLVRVELPQPRVEHGTLVAHALTVDRFGNVGLNVSHDQLAGTGIAMGKTLEIEAGGEPYLAFHAGTFADVKPGELIVYEDAYRMLAVAINRGDAAGTLGLAPDSEVRLRPR